MIYRMLILGFSLFLLAGCGGEKAEQARTATPETGITKEMVDYTVDGVTLKGYIAYDAGQSGKRPGVLVVHEWWGQSDYIRHRADMLAALGYTAMAVDMYGEGKYADHPEDAQSFMMEVMKNMPTGEARFLEALKLLKAHPTVDAGNIAAIGYCFGGGVVLHMARIGTNLDGVVSFHGSLATQQPAQPGEVKAAVLVLNGGADPMVTDEQITAFKEEMDAAGVDYKFISYEGALHGFTNPGATEKGEKFSMPLGYNKAADDQSWQEMQDFFDRIFEKE